jgi:hypothetical protein
LTDVGRKMMGLEPLQQEGRAKTHQHLWWPRCWEEHLGRQVLCWPQG